MSYGVFMADEHGCAPQEASTSCRITSRHRGLYYDTKHSSWRVRIFYLGKQRHIGRYKDETVAAQAYDRAAYYLYGTRANLNFRLKDVLADPLDVPDSIKQAKEQGVTGHSIRPIFSAASCSSSSGSSACSYSPHHSMQPSTAAGMNFAHSQVPAVYLQQQQQLAHVTSQQQLLQQQGGAGCMSAAPWQLGMQQQQQQQQLAFSLGSAPLNQGLPNMQSHQQVLLPGTGMQVVSSNHAHPQQQAGQGGVVPDVVASVIAALDLPPQSASPAISASSTSFAAWANSSSAFGAGAASQPTVPGHMDMSAFGGAAGMIGSSSAFQSSDLGIFLGQAGGAGANIPVGCVLNAQLAHADSIGMQQQAILHRGTSSGAAMFPMQLLDGAAAPAALLHQQAQHAHLLQVQHQEQQAQQQLQLQLQAQGMSVAAPQHSLPGTGLPQAQQGMPLAMDPMQAGVQVMVSGGGVMMSRTTPSSACWPQQQQQQMLLSAAMM